jgi:hypothetical protein
MNLLKNQPQFHRELFHYVDGKRVPKEEFTIEDLWVYYNLVVYGKSNTLQSGMTVEEFERQRQRIIDGISPISPDAADFLADLVSNYGIEVDLFATDDLVQINTDSVPELKDIRSFIRDAQVYISREELRNQMG